MKRCVKMKKLIVFLSVVIVLFTSSCGFISLLGTPTRHERKIAAEYDLSQRKGEKILMLVDQPGWLNTEVNLRYYLTNAVADSLVAKVRISPESFVEYSQLSEFRSNISNFSQLTHQDVGKAMGADMVLVVRIDRYELSNIKDTNYYTGLLHAKCVLLDAKTGDQLWPESGSFKDIKVGFDVEPRGRKAAVGRLANAVAHCITRYMYDCPKAKFDIFEERKTGW